ncbi:hypothetical protein ARHIZOSPH14_27550 [Agromyces rhizosphaerae]|uniref:Uncharacterized protein n=1 Tax=Agromyces rhizosphaerae TaxID=88374 RepID=A0A9W6CU43_9MICO|nr:hypothetical protein [Agromyces rhizosphaerae]GLI28513.1 hypothetical protein ARHIZOSPH14_27550 [Agromyces rhizosphaerae]
MKIRITGPARRHRIGNERILYAMQHATYTGPDPREGSDGTYFIGEDQRGVELEIVAVPDDRNPGDLAVIHAMPTDWRNR